MREAGVSGETDVTEVGFETYGVRGSLSAFPPELLARAESLLPPGWAPCPPSSSGGRFSLREQGGGYDVSVDEVTQAQTVDLDVALGVLDAQIRAYAALRAPERIFVHAGVVAYGDGAIVIPGASFSGKTTLVAALVQAGAVYYSDEFAVLDDGGLVHPYPRPLSIRRGRGRAVEDLDPGAGIAAGSEPLPVALIAVTSYRPGVQCKPQRQSAGTGAMALLSNTVPARDRPEQSLAAVRGAAASALVLEGERGEAVETAADLLDGLRPDASR